MDNEALAFESEKSLIELFGRKDNGTGILRNLTDGGEGQSGLHDEGRKKISAALKGRIISPEWREKVRGTMKARGCRPSIGAAKSGGRYQRTPEHRLKLSGILKQAAKFRKPISDDYRKALSERLSANPLHLGHKHSEESRLKMSAARKGKSLTPAQQLARKKAGEMMRGSGNYWFGKRSPNAHIRWHVNKNIVKDGCAFCQPMVT